jgi:uncharacterized protein
LDLFEATGETEWLKEAIALDQVLETFYEDKNAGGFFLTPTDHEDMLVRQKPGYDGAEPCGNSIHAHNLLRLKEFTTKESYGQRAENIFRAFRVTLGRSPRALSEMLIALDFFYDAPKEIVLVQSDNRDSLKPFLDALGSVFLPNRVLVTTGAGDSRALEQLAPWVAGKTAMDGKPTAYVCENRVCQRPTQDVADFIRQISSVTQ